MTDIIHNPGHTTHSAARHNMHRSPNYALRRIVAVGMLGLASVGIGLGTKAVVADTLDRWGGTDIPDVHEAHEHPEKFTVIKTQRGDTLDEIAQKYTTNNHDYRGNSQHLRDQLVASYPEFHGILQPDQTLVVPVTTTQPPETEPPKQNS